MPDNLLILMLPQLVQLIPYLATILRQALAGGIVADENPWCLNVIGLREVCDRLRLGDASTVALVAQILGSDKLKDLEDLLKDVDDEK